MRILSSDSIALAFSCSLALFGCGGDDSDSGGSGASAATEATDGGQCPRGEDQCPADTTGGGSQTGSGDSMDGGDAPTDGDGSSSADTGGPTTGVGETGDDCGMTGTVMKTFTVDMDMCMHKDFVMLDGDQSVDVTVNGDITVAIGGTPGLDPATGTLNPDCSFTATGTGMVAGMPDISIEWSGSFSGGDLCVNSLTLGGDGKLPGACPIVYGAC